jgi:hypothetical protein
MQLSSEIPVAWHLEARSVAGAAGLPTRLSIDAELKAIKISAFDPKFPVNFTQTPKDGNS